MAMYQILLVDLAVGVALAAVTLAILRAIYGKAAPGATEIGHEASSAGLLDALTVPLSNSQYVATAGRILDNYYDADALLADPQNIEPVLSQLVDLLKQYSSAKVCLLEKDSGPIGMLVHGGLIESKLGRPVSTIRVRRAVRKMAIKGGPIASGDQVVIVQDVMTTGFQIIRAERLLRTRGARLIAVVALTDRHEKKDPEFEKLNVEIVAVKDFPAIVARRKELGKTSA